MGVNEQNGMKNPRILHGGLSTVAFLTAQLDAGSDYLATFLPLVIDAICSQLAADSFTAEDVQHVVLQVHKILLPEQSITTLLHRATKKGWLKRVYRRFAIDECPDLAPVRAKITSITKEQQALAAALAGFAKERGVELDAANAVQELVNFLNERHVALFLDGIIESDEKSNVPDALRPVLAEFTSTTLTASTTHSLYHSMRQLLEGLVVYRSAFLPDLAEHPDKRFDDLAVFFDNDLVLGVAGLHGSMEKEYLTEAVRILRDLGAPCYVFEETLKEVDGVLAYYESLTPSKLLQSARGGPLERHLFAAKMNAGAIHYERALIRKRLLDAGIRIRETPRRNPKYVGDEKALAEALINPHKQDKDSPRIWHDVNCIAAVLTVRAGYRTNRLDSAKALFVSSSYSVINTARRHYEEREDGKGTIPPMVHISTLTNIAWLKRPQLNKELSLLDAITLCSAALSPSPETWRKFTEHLRALVEKNELTTEAAISVVIDNMTEHELMSAEIADGDEARTYNEVIAAVTAQQKEAYEPLLDSAKQQAAEEKKRADELESARQAECLHREARVYNIAHKAAAIIANLCFGIVGLIVVAGTILGLIATLQSNNKWLAIAPVAIVIAVAAGTALNLHSLDLLRRRSIDFVATKMDTPLRRILYGRDAP